MRVLVTGWPSFVHGEATAGDVLSMDAVVRTLSGAGVAYDTVWSPVFRPGGLQLEDAPPERYTHLVFACGPIHGEQVRYLHRRYARCRRIAVGVSVVDPEDPAVTGFDMVLARDGEGLAPRRDLAGSSPIDHVPVVGVIMAPGQSEYGDRRRHDDVAATLTAWLGDQDCARLPVDTRLDAYDWRACASPGQLASTVRRLDLVVTMRLHGLVLALRHGIPALAVDPVAGGAKVSAQARAWTWPAVLTPRELPDPGQGTPAGADADGPLRRWFDWCLSPDGRAAAQRRAVSDPGPNPLLSGLVRNLRTPEERVCG